MAIGELWIAHPIFPWIMIILALWVSVATILIVRMWNKVKLLEHPPQNILSDE